MLAGPSAVNFLICMTTWLTVGYALAFGDTGGLGQFAGTTFFFGTGILDLTRKKDLNKGNIDW